MKVSAESLHQSPPQLPCLNFLVEHFTSHINNLRRQLSAQEISQIERDNINVGLFQRTAFNSMSSLRKSNRNMVL